MKFVLDTFTSSLRLDKLEDEEFEVVKKDVTEHSRHLSARLKTFKCKVWKTHRIGYLWYELAVMFGRKIQFWTKWIFFIQVRRES
jgi:hypothetical protein